MSKHIVEFFGMPGSGKTHLADRLTVALRQRGIHTGDSAIVLSRASTPHRVAVKIFLVMRCLLVDTAIARQVASVVRAYGPGSLRKTIKLVYNWLYLISLIRVESRHNAVVILDQGLGQALWSTLFYGQVRPDDKPEERLFMTILDSLGYPSVSIVCVRADNDIIERRLNGRKNGRSPLDTDRAAFWRRAIDISNESRVMLGKLSVIVPNVHMTSIENNEGMSDSDAVMDLVEGLDLN